MVPLPTRPVLRGLGYRFLAAAYRYPREDSIRAAGQVAATLDESRSLAETDGEHGVVRRLHALADELTGKDREALERSYVALFRHSVDGPCPPYECLYGDRGESLQLPHELADIAAYYRAHGLELGDGVGERPDFVAVECEFRAFGALKAAWAEDRGDERLAESTRETMRSFLRAHLGRWFPAFAGRVLREDAQSFYSRLTEAARDFVLADCAELGIPPGPGNLRLDRPAPPPDACFDCSLRCEDEAGTETSEPERPV